MGMVEALGGAINRALRVEAETARLRADLTRLQEAAWWVVANWDTESTQNNSMPYLRRALGLPGERPTRAEARARVDEYLRSPKMWTGEAPLPGVTEPSEPPSWGQSAC